MIIDKIIKADKYNIHIGNNVLSDLSIYLSGDELIVSKIFVLVDENSRRYCLPLFKTEINRNFEILEIKSGEQNKTLSTSAKLWKQLSSKEAQRSSLLINLGGGVITDIGGFVASAFKRGIRFINIPTTLLSQVDASVGGKTGVDLDNLKNEIGLFSNPKAVYIYPEFLKTLPERELLSGYAEVIKHALISDAKYWQSLKLKTQKLKVKTINDWTPIIFKSVEIKNKIVKTDPLEKNIRKKLNFGHTVGHAIESYSLSNDKKPLLHGEAIAIGMICESYLSHKKTGLTSSELKEITLYINSIYKPYRIKAEYFTKLIDLMQHDKKNRQGNINFTLLTNIGSSEIDIYCTEKEIRESLKYYMDNS